MTVVLNGSYFTSLIARFLSEIKSNKTERSFNSSVRHGKPIDTTALIYQFENELSKRSYEKTNTIMETGGLILAIRLLFIDYIRLAKKHGDALVKKAQKIHGKSLTGYNYVRALNHTDEQLKEVINCLSFEMSPKTEQIFKETVLHGFCLAIALASCDTIDDYFSNRVYKHYEKLNFSLIELIALLRNTEPEMSLAWEFFTVPSKEEIAEKEEQIRKEKKEQERKAKEAEIEKANERYRVISIIDSLNQKDIYREIFDD